MKHLDAKDISERRIEDFLKTTSWDSIITGCDSINGLSEKDKFGAKNALKLIRDRLGEGFLEKGYRDRHPLVLIMLNQASWTRLWLIRLANMISTATSFPGFPGLFKKIFNSQRYYEGIFTLENAIRFYKVGFQISFEPKIHSSSSKSVPDLGLNDPKDEQELFVELSIIGESESQKDSSSTTFGIFRSLLGSVPSMLYCGRIHKYLAPRHLDEIIAEITSAIQELKRSKTFVEIVEKNTIELAIATQAGQDTIKRWADLRNLHIGELDSPPIDTNEVIRTQLRIEAKQSQLPISKPNMIILSNTNLFLNTRDVEKTVGLLEEKVFEHDHIYAATIQGTWMGSNGENETTALGDHLLIKATELDLFCKRYLILFNKYCPHMIPEATKSMIRNAFALRE